MKYINTLVSGILGGICIGIGGTAFLSCEYPFIGAILFAIGLLTVCVFGLDLFTGQIGYIFQIGKSYVPEILIVIGGNLIGAWIMGQLVKLGGLTEVVSKATVHAENTLGDNLLSLFILAALCNVLIYIAVEGFHSSENEVARIVILFMGVTVFIMCGFKHSIAEMFYFSASGLSKDMIIPTLVMIGGNAVGGILAHNLNCHFNDKAGEKHERTNMI